MKIKDWHADERPREKLLKYGAAQLSNAELLAIFLRTGTAQKDVLTLAHELVSHFGSLHKLFNASFAEFDSLSGVGLSKYTQLQATLELAKRTIISEINTQPIFNNPELVKSFFQLQLAHLPQECFMGMLLDSQHTLLAHKILFTGTINQATIYPREIIKWALEHNASNLLIAHNHPNGTLFASKEDIELTTNLSHLLKQLDIQLLDHFIVSKQGIVALSDIMGNF